MRERIVQLGLRDGNRNFRKTVMESYLVINIVKKIRLV